MKKQGILVLMMYSSLSIAMDKEAAKKLFNYEVGFSYLKECCKKDLTQDCVFIAQHLKAARIHSLKRFEISQYQSELSNVVDPIMQKPAQEKLEEMKQNCPTCNNTYWNNLTTRDKEKITSTTENILKLNQVEDKLPYELKCLHERLN